MSETLREKLHRLSNGPGELQQACWDAMERIDDHAAYIEKLEKRLEITEEYDIDGNPIPIPPGDRDRAIDGITARDCTIRLQDDRIEELEAQVKKLKASAKKQCRVDRHGN